MKIIKGEVQHNFPKSVVASVSAKVGRCGVFSTTKFYFFVHLLVIVLSQFADGHWHLLCGVVKVQIHPHPSCTMV